MGVPGGLYRPTPRGYNGNPAGRGAQPSVSTLSGFCAGCWGPPASGFRRLPAPWSTGRSHCQGLVGGWLLLLNLGGEGFAEVGVATVPLPGGRSL